jgi:PAS domain S-box-containing protein
MFEVLSGLFDITGFTPRKECGAGWTPALVWLHATSDLFIWLAYVSIPLALFYFTRRRDLPFPRLFILFALFILACGTTHLIDALIFEYPIYRFAGVMKLVTAVVSWATVIALVPAIPRVMHAVTEAPKPGDDTKLHKPLPGSVRVERPRDYIIAVLAGALAVLIRAAVDPVLRDDHIFVVPLLAVVYVSWQCGFRPGVVCLLVALGGYTFFFVHPRGSFYINGVGPQLAVALFFFCGVACAALGESQRAAQRRARLALATAVARREELESEIVRRRVVEAALRQREADLVAAQRETAEALARLNAFLDNAPLGIAFFDPDLRYVRINTYLAAANGKPVEEHSGKTLSQMVPDFPVELLARYRKTAGPDGQAFAAQLRRPGRSRPDAERVWQVTVFPVRIAGRNLGAGVVAQDVTDRLRAEEALRESEERFRNLADTAPALIWLSGLEGTRTYFNKTWLEFTGRATEQESGYGWADDIHPEDHDRYLVAYSTAFAERRPFELEYRLKRSDGAYRWVLARGTPRFASGAFAGFVGLCLDVTERREALEAVRQSESFRRSVFENSPDCLNVIDTDGTILEINAAGCQLLELDGPEAVLNAPWAELWPAANRETVREAVTAACSGRAVRFHGFCPTVSGTPKYWDVSVAPLPGPDGTPYRLIGISRDVTEQRRAEDAVRASERRFRTLTEAVPQMVWTADPTGAVTFFNRRWDEYTRSPLVFGGHSEGWGGAAVHAADAEPFRTSWQRAVAEPAEGFTRELRLRRAADGEYRWMLAVALPLRDVTGAVSEWVGTLTDIDDQKRQTELLARLVRERTTELESANAALTNQIEERRAAEERIRAIAAELERSNEELEKFAYIASHDLQEPLRKIQAFGDRLRNKCRDQLPDNGKEFVDRMLSAAGRMRRLIDDLLSFSRVTTQQRPFARIELTRLVREVASDLDERIDQEEGTVVIGDLPTVEADISQMRQLFQNLIVNAVKFHRPGVPPVVEITGALEPARPGADEADPVYRIQVRDNGIGFEDKYRDRIFDVFQRLHGRNQYEGTGVGLAICRKIVERHGGTITARGRPGEGATFVVALPVRRSPSREATADDEQPDKADHDPDGRRRPGRPSVDP